MQFRLLGISIFPFTLFVFKGARFNCPTDFRAVTYNWNTVTLFIKIRYVRISDYDRVVFRYSCGTCVKNCAKNEVFHLGFLQ